VLNNKVDRKSIIIHLLGTHRAFHNHYPDKYNFFKNRVGMPGWVKDGNKDEYNEYDNAILYNDYIISRIINILKQKNMASTLVYFSDHGEEVYDTKGLQFTGRNEHKPTKAMYTIPFITWLSPSWKLTKPDRSLKRYINRPYINSDFIYSWAGLANIDFKSNNQTRSIYHPAFKNLKRLIGNPKESIPLIDFDTLL